MTQTNLWPALPLAEWKDTCATLHMWTQIIGKVRLALSPNINHWWGTALYVTARGLTTSAIPYEKGIFEIHFDLIAHELRIETSLGESRAFRLMPRTPVPAAITRPKPAGTVTKAKAPAARSRTAVKAKARATATPKRGAAKRAGRKSGKRGR